MELLRILTLGYVAVLVLVLAVSLFAVWIFLRRIAHALREARTSLAEVARATARFDEVLRPLPDLFQEAANDMKTAECALEEADNTLRGQLNPAGLAR